MKKMLRGFSVLFMLLAILSGCAIYKGAEIKVDNQVGETRSKIIILVDPPPVMTVGIPLADYSQGQEFVIPCPRDLVNSEYRPARKSWMVLGLDEQGNAYPGVVILDLKEKTPAGDTVVKWIYQSEKNSQAHVEGLELMKEWQKPLESIDWSTLSEAEKANCIKVVRACLKNLRYRQIRRSPQTYPRSPAYSYLR